MLAQQQYLDFGPEAHIDLLHPHLRGENSGVYFLEYDSFGGHSPLGTYPKPLAREVAAQRAMIADGLYVGQQAGRLCSGHTVSNVSFLSSFYVDLDTYNTSYNGADCESVLDAISAMHPDLPRPTISGSSGRGMYLVWTFTQGKPKSFLPHWQAIQDALVDALKSFGADPKARDAARVLRVSGSLNHKSGTRVGLRQYGDPVAYERLQKWSNAYRKANRPERTKRQHKNNRKASVSNLPVFNGYTLAFKRMQDYQLLARLRGGKFTEHRRRAIFLFACAASWFCNDPETLRSEIEGFIDDYIFDPRSYKGVNLGQVFIRHGQAKEGVKLRYKGKECDPRYRHKTKTIISELEITEAEQRQLLVTFSGVEKQRRNTNNKRQKRREGGVKPQAEYLAKVSTKAQQNAERALQLHLAGLSNKYIAEDLGVTSRTVRNYLDRHRDKCGNHVSPCMYKS